MTRLTIALPAVVAVLCLGCGDDDPLVQPQEIDAAAANDANHETDGAVEAPKLRVSQLEVTADSYPFGAADQSRVPIDLAARGYVEEEFIVSGMAKTYDWEQDGAVVRTEPSPYATRVLVRRPDKRATFSGRVIVELLNPTNGFDLQIGWALSHEHFMREGDAWVGVTAKPIAMVALQAFNAERYSELSWNNPVPTSDARNCVMGLPADSTQATENGLVWDIFSQIGRYLRSPNELLGSLPVKRVYGFGYSQSGGYLGTYINAIHPRDVKEFGRSVFDAYFIGTYSGVSPIHQCTTALMRTDPRAQIKDVGVPTIRIVTQSDYVLFAQPRENNAGLPDAFWHYEIAGAAHATPAELDYAPKLDDIVKAKVTPPVTECEPIPGMRYPRSPFPLGVAFNAAWANLDRWLEDKVAPPAAPPIMQTDRMASLDEHGNALGGVRSTALEVPTGTWHGNAATSIMDSLICYLAGYEVPFDQVKLMSLYPTHDDYVRRVEASANQLVEQRFLLEADAEKLIDEAKNSAVP
jgi:hypothetical protein